MAPARCVNRGTGRHSARLRLYSGTAAARDGRPVRHGGARRSAPTHGPVGPARLGTEWHARYVTALEGGRQRGRMQTERRARAIYRPGAAQPGPYGTARHMHDGSNGLIGTALTGSTARVSQQNDLVLDRPARALARCSAAPGPAHVLAGRVVRCRAGARLTLTCMTCHAVVAEPCGADAMHAADATYDVPRRCRAAPCRAGPGRAYDVPRRWIEREVNNKYIIYISVCKYSKRDALKKTRKGNQ